MQTDPLSKVRRSPKSLKLRRALFEHLERRTLLAAGPSSFTLALLSDTQYVVETYPENFIAQTQWLKNNAVDRNIAFAAHQGDLLRRGYSDSQIANADGALDILNGVIPYTVSIGNHDYDNQFDDLDHHISSAKFSEAFGDARYQAIPNSGFGGSSLDQRNRYHTFTAAGQEFLVLSLEWEAPDSAIAWGQSVINAHRHLPVILTTHEYMNTGGRTTSPLDPGFNDGQDIFDKLVKLNPQIFLVVGGHTGGERHQTSLNNAGTAVVEVLADYSKRNNNFGDGWFQMLEFDLQSNIIRATTYSPMLNAWETDADSQYTVAMNFASRFAFAPAGAPLANDDLFDLLPGLSITGEVIANDHGAPGSTLTASLVSGPANGSLAWNADGTFTFTPSAGFRGTDSFTYTINDGVNNSNIAKVSLRVNTAPLAADDVVKTPESKPVTFSVVANDSDADANALKPILSSLPANGAVFVNANGTFTYTPDPKFVGIDTFTYVVSDGIARGTAATVSVNVRPNAPVYDYPIAETTTIGTRTNSYTATFADDGVEETLKEALSSGISRLDHRWQFNVTGGTDVMFAIKAHRTWGKDEFRFQYSTNGSTWLDMGQIVPASSRSVTRIFYDAQEPYQMWTLPATTKGNVWIRATDTNTSEAGLESLVIDEMFIRSGTVFPTVSISAAAGSESPSQPVVFTVTRAGNTSAALEVNYVLSGSAYAESDYSAPSGTLTIPAGAASATFSVIPMADGSVEGDETIVASLAPSDAFDLSAASASATISDEAPAGLSASADAASATIHLAWSDPFLDEEGYEIQRSGNGASFMTIAIVGPGVVSYDDAGLGAGTYSYRVRGRRGSLDSSYSNVAAAGIPDLEAPSNPTNLTSTGATASSISLAWTAATDNIAVVAYDLYRDGSLVGSTPGTSLMVNGLSPSTAYSFQVIARDAAGNVSAPSNTLTASTPAQPAPIAPSGLAATKLSSRRVRLNWLDNSSNETGFRVWSSRDNVTWTLMSTTAADIRTYTTSTLARGTWHFRISAFNSAGDSLFSNTVKVNV